VYSQEDVGRVLRGGGTVEEVADVNAAIRTTLSEEDQNFLTFYCAGLTPHAASQKLGNTHRNGSRRLKRIIYRITTQLEEKR
jgi:hypothetical protein